MRIRAFALAYEYTAAKSAPGAMGAVHQGCFSASSGEGFGRMLNTRLIRIRHTRRVVVEQAVDVALQRIISVLQSAEWAPAVQDLGDWCFSLPDGRELL